MLNTTLPFLLCPRCAKPLELRAVEKQQGLSPEVFEVRTGHLDCQKCKGRFPILAGVALVVEDVGAYLIEHVKGVSQWVADAEIPAEFRSDFLEAKTEITVEHIEDDLEAERVNALYVMNHYLHANPVPKEPWWAPRGASGSALLDTLVREHWDSGPFAVIEEWMKSLHRKELQSLVELGCGVGGLCSRLRPSLSRYVGVDSSFASIALARHLALGADLKGKIRLPEDLLQGPVSREVRIPVEGGFDGKADFIVADVTAPPLKKGQWDVSVALNVIDMLDDPSLLPELQKGLVKDGGTVIQSAPYIWHQEVARKLKKKLPREVRDSARAAEWLYEQAGLSVLERKNDVPWLFFKHVRQLEVYSVHMFTARRR